MEAQDDPEPELGLDPQAEEPAEEMPIERARDSISAAAVGSITKKVSKAIAEGEHQPEEEGDNLNDLTLASKDEIMVCENNENEVPLHEQSPELRQSPQTEEPAENVHIQLKGATEAKDEVLAKTVVNFVDAVLDE